MAVAEVRRVVRMSGDPDSGWRLWSNGLIEAFGAALPVDFTTRWPNRAVDLWIYDEMTPAGVVLTDDGARHAFGGAPGGGAPLPAGPYRIYRFLLMDPAGTGRGYVFDFSLGHVKVGTGTPDLDNAPDGVGGNPNIVRDVVGDYATGRWVALLADGRLRSSGGFTPGWTSRPGTDLWRRLDVVGDWVDATPTFYSANRVGEVFPGNDAEGAYRGPVLAAHGDTVRGLDIVSDGTGGDPLIVALVEASGAELRYTVSAPPTVSVDEPTGTITDTTRPEGSWTYADQNGDDQVAAEVAWFTDAQYGIGGFNAATSPAVERQTITLRNFTAATPTVDLTSDTYRMYVRAQDSAGQWSTWDHSQFDVDITPPSAPTITATPGDDWTVDLVIADGDTTVEVEHSDDSGATWLALRGSPVDVDGSGDGTAVDHEAPFNVARTYRARSVIGNLRSAWSTTDDATVTESRQWIAYVPDGPLVTLRVPPGMEWTSTVSAAAYTGAEGGDPENVVISAGRSAPRPPFTCRYRSIAERDELDALWNGERTVLVRSPAGMHWWVRVTGDVRTTLDGITWGTVSVPAAVVRRPA